MKARLASALLLVLGCQTEPEPLTNEPATATAEIDPALVRELLGESLQVEGDQIRADGMLIRLAFDPLIRQTGPVSVQLVQGEGYRLSGITDGSPLWLLGLRDGDLLTGVDQQPILGREHELRSSYESRPSRVELSYLRGTEARTVELRIAAGSAWRSAKGPASLDPTPPLRPPISPRSSPTKSAVDIAAGVRCERGASPELIGRCEIERQKVDELRDKPDSLLRQARVVPDLRDGATQGLKLYGVRPGSMPHLFGVQNGDTIKRVNGHQLTSPAEALAAYEALSSEVEFRVEIERRSQPLRLELAIVDRLSGPPAGLGGAPKPSPDLRDPFGDR
ncbi:MAG: hypothetical protein R6X02_00375 [Enhygromyxa sp.]